MLFLFVSVLQIVLCRCNESFFLHSVGRQNGMQEPFGSCTVVLPFNLVILVFGIAVFFPAPGLNTFLFCIRAVCQVPRSIYVTTFFATTRIICALTDIKRSSPKDLSPPTGRPYHVRKYHYSHSPCLGLPHDAVNRAVRHRMNRSLGFFQEKKTGSWRSCSAACPSGRD